jgi:predicted acyltransferase
MAQTTESGRLASIDVLRGFDMFFLVGAGEVLRDFLNGFKSDALTPVLEQLDHHWGGFTAWDIIMPLFLFTAGISMPFSFSKFKEKGHTITQLWGKIFKRFCLLFVLGWIAQGNLLAFDVNKFHIYCNTLHSIAVGYLITAIIVLTNKRLNVQLIIGCVILIAYWACLMLGGDFSKDGNLAIRIDRAVFGRFDDGTHYTWLLSSLGFTVTVLSGYFAGMILKRPSEAVRKLKTLCIAGLSMLIGGLLWSYNIPLIKHIWSPSMVLFSSGICFLLLALSFLLTDILQLKGAWVAGLRIFGMNSITAYMLHQIFHNFKDDAEQLLFGFRQFTGDFYPALIALGGFALLFAILAFMYKYKIFLKV